MTSVIVDSSRSSRLCCNFLRTLLIGCCMALTLTILNVRSLRTLIGKGDHTRHMSCREFLASGRFEDNDWRPTGCRSFHYNKSDVAQCMNRTQLSTKRRNYFLFIGDSRVREQYHLFVDAIASKPYKLEAEKGSATYSEELFDTEYQWNTHLKSIQIDLHQLLTGRKPTFVVVGFGMWYLRDSGGCLQPGLRQYSDQLKSISAELNRLNNVTAVIFMINAPLFRHRIYGNWCRNNSYWQHGVDERNNSVCLNPWMRYDWVKAYNKAAVRELSNNSRSTHLWMTSRTVAHSFAFDIVDSMHLFSITGTVPPSPALHLRAQMLLNFHCNQFRYAATGTDDIGVCCGRKDR